VSCKLGRVVLRVAMGTPLFSNLNLYIRLLFVFELIFHGNMLNVSGQNLSLVAIPLKSNVFSLKGNR